MKNIILTTLAAVLLFSVSAALSLYLNTPKANPDAGKDKEKDKAAKEKAAKEKDKDKDGPDRKSTDTDPIVRQGTTKADEEAAALLARLRERTGLLERREDEVKRQEGRLQLVMDDIRGERAVIDTLRKQLSDDLKGLKDRADGLEKRARGLEDQKAAAAKVLADLKGRQIELEKNETKNLTKMATISDSMPPEKAAAIIKQMADSGQLETAVKILGEMRERRAASVLGEMTDAVLAAQLLEKLRGLKRPPVVGAGGVPPA